MGDHKKGAVNIMIRPFDEEYILKTYIESEIQEASEKTAKEAAKKAAKKATEKVFKEAAEKAEIKAKAIAKKLYYKGNSIEDIADILDISQNDIERWIEDFNS